MKYFTDYDWDAITLCNFIKKYLPNNAKVILNKDNIIAVNLLDFNACHSLCGNGEMQKLCYATHSKMWDYYFNRPIEKASKIVVIFNFNYNRNNNLAKVIYSCKKTDELNEPNLFRVTNHHDMFWVNTKTIDMYHEDLNMFIEKDLIPLCSIAQHTNQNPTYSECMTLEYSYGWFKK